MAKGKKARDAKRAKQNLSRRKAAKERSRREAQRPRRSGMGKGALVAAAMVASLAGGWP